MTLPKRRVLPRAILLLGSTGLVVASVGILLYRGYTTRLGAATAVTPTAPVGRGATATPAPQIKGNDWTQYRYDVYGTGVNPEEILSSATVSRLQQRWVLSAHTAFGATPAIVNGVIYIANGKSLYAYDLQSGTTRWRFDGLGSATYLTTSSVAVDPVAQLAYYGTPDALVYAVNIQTGQEAWHTRLGDPAQGAYIWSSPLLVNGRVYIGLASQNDQPCVRGGVFALQAASGKVLWTHYMTIAGVLGGGVWSSVTAVPELRAIIATTGNPCNQPTDTYQEDSIVGLNWDTGATLWSYHALDYDDCDCDFGEGAVNFALNGQQYFVAGNKYGGVYAVTLQGQGAKLAWSHRIAQTDSAYHHIAGGIFEPPAYSNGAVFVAGGRTLDGKCAASIWSFQAATGKENWHICTQARIYSPAAIEGDVLFVGETGAVTGYDVATGHVVWQAKIDGSTWGGVAISHGLVVVGTTNGKLYCFGLNNAAS